ncbi:hypothetical protein [Streptomyces niveus]|uniref:hypothetical protein n=1 Tax=Streptomyces niveus TaxID=193462 RepID=UPI0034478A0B
MAVSLDKTEKILFFLAVVAHPGTENAKVHNLVLAENDRRYDAHLEELDLQARAVEGGEMHIVIAGDRSAAYAAALNGATSEEMLDRWLGQQGV